MHLIIVLIIVCNEKKADDCEILLEFYSERQLTFLNYFPGVYEPGSDEYYGYDYTRQRTKKNKQKVPKLNSSPVYCSQLYCNLFDRLFLIK